MQRIPTKTRDDWPKLVESQGLLFHSIDDRPYWDESAYYLFEASEVDAIEEATARLDAMCLEAVEHVIREDRLDEFAIPEAFHDFVRESWDRDERTIYGRFDLAFDGLGPPRLLEYNADTPTSLLEAAVIQWYWFKDMVGPLDEADRRQFDQFNSIHERLIEAWAAARRDLGGRVAFAAMTGSLEDLMTVTYLRDTATQAGLKTQPITVEGIGWHAGRRTFTDLFERPIEVLFKLYPWEWMIREPFGAHLAAASTRWLEPPWKMILSNKAILVVLSELFPESPYLLRAGREPVGANYVAKPLLSREGANVTIVRDGRVVAETGGDYGDGPAIYQEYHALGEFGGRSMVVGSWMVNGHACGMGLREDDGPITTNTSRFLPHLFRKSGQAKPPVMSLRGGTSPTPSPEDPLFDRWLDR